MTRFTTTGVALALSPFTLVGTPLFASAQSSACRYWCPLAKLMQLQSKIFTRFGLSRFHIVANDKCIACNECSRNCQVGIDVMQYALKQETLDNATSSCIGCGVCVSVCPMDTLSFDSTGASDEALPPPTQAH